MPEPAASQPDAPNPSNAAPHPAPRHEPPQETIKETFESIIIAFVLAFAFRGYIVEAFVIPTGSMAPTLMGEHLDARCVQCGYRFATDVPGRPPETGRGLGGGGDNPAPGRAAQPLVCPMCRYPNPIEPGTTVASGDRILVQKYVYELTEPRRYDVVVFKNPEQPRKNFIKRLVGLPGEELLLFEGNVYTRPVSDNGEPLGSWGIARKTDADANRQWERVQRAVWQPIYDSQYIPRDGGAGTPERHDYPWAVPWVADDALPAADAWQLDDRRSYRYDADAPGRIRFDFDRLGYQTRAAPGPMPQRYPYNQFKYHDTGDRIPWHPIEDVRLAATFQPDEPGLGAAMSTTARLDGDTPETLTAAIDAVGTLTLEATAPDGTTRELARSDVGAFRAGRNREMELWYVDQEASVWLDGRRVLVHPFDVPMEQLIRRDPARPLPQPSIDVAGSPVTLHKVQLDRDIYYSTRSASGQRARGRIDRNRAVELEPVALGPDEFFCVGDNTPWSYDGRYWGRVDAWVQELYFEGVDEPQRLGVVPRELMMGRAFFVYYPAPFALRPGAPRVFPNFGDMRVIR